MRHGAVLLLVGGLSSTGCASLIGADWESFGPATDGVGDDASGGGDGNADASDARRDASVDAPSGDTSADHVQTDASICGNGVVEVGESCDKAINAGKPGSCPTTCGDGNACTTDVLSGSAANCTAKCTNTATVTACSGATPDGCCPAACTASTDRDCPSGPLSCFGGAPGQADCGPSSNESCCISPLVAGGTVQLDSTHAATVSDYRLDKYEITVGRFRKFVDAAVAGWTPTAGAGKHTHLNGGSGLSDGSSGYEPGWDVTWNTYLPRAKATWDGSTGLACNSTYQTWTSAAGTNENRPLNCAAWFEAAAFCIWDGGFLPSEAEWNYAAAGGNEGRQYPWSVPASSTTIDDTYASYYVDSTRQCFGDGVNGCAQTDLIFVGSKPRGNGKWGHSDLAGNVWEWTTDWYLSSYAMATSTNYSNVAPPSYRVVRGGCFGNGAAVLFASYRNESAPMDRNYNLGARCARSP